MMEEIQALMPLFERISEGALWAFIVYMASWLITNLAWPIVFAVVFVVAARKASVIWAPVAPNEAQPRIDFYELTQKGREIDVCFLGRGDEMAEFMKAVARRADHIDGDKYRQSLIYGRTYLHGSDLHAIMKEWEGEQA